MNRAVFLDRDNTIIHNDADLGDPAQVRLIQGAATAIASLCGLGYKVIVITNQGGVARGKYSEDDVLLVHERIDQLVRESANGARIERFYYCPYHPEATVEAYRGEHPSRKPNPGMLLEAAEDLELDLPQSWTIGDQVRDVQAGAAAGTRTILLRSDADLLKPIEPERLPAGKPHGAEAAAATRPPGRGEPPDYIVRTLTEAVRVIAHARRPEAAEHLHRAHVAGKRFDAAAVAKLQHARPETKPPSQDDQSAPQTPDPAEPGGSAGTAAGGEAQVRRTSGKPFRPWSGMPGDEGSQDPDPDRAERVRARFRKLREQRAGDEPAAVGDAAAEPGKQPAPPAGPTGEAGAGGVLSSLDHTLRLMLQELRSQRGTSDDFSYLYVVAIVLQMVAGLCLVGGLWMGAGDDALFMRWIGAGVMVQLATITALLFSR